MPFYVARPHVLADEFVPGYLGDSFGLFPFVHGDPLANQFDGPFLVRLIRKEVTHISGFPFGIESRDPDIPSCWHSGTMRRTCCWSIPCHNQADPLPTNDTPASRPTGAESVAMKWARFPNLAARPAKPSLNQGPIQVRARRALRALGEASTSQISEWTHPRGRSPANADRHPIGGRRGSLG